MGRHPNPAQDGRGGEKFDYNWTKDRSLCLAKADVEDKIFDRQKMVLLSLESEWRVIA